MENEGLFSGFTDEEQRLLSGFTSKQRISLILSAVDYQVPGKANRLWNTLEGELKAGESRQETSLLPSYAYFLLCNSDLSLEEQWSAFNAAMNPEMSLEEGVSLKIWMDKLIKNKIRAIILDDNLGFILAKESPYSPTEPWWQTVKIEEVEGVQVSYIETLKKDNLYLVRTKYRWEMSDGKSLLTEKLVYAPTVEGLKLYLQQKPFRLVVPDSHQ